MPATKSPARAKPGPKPKPPGEGRTIVGVSMTAAMRDHYARLGGGSASRGARQTLLAAMTKN